MSRRRTLVLGILILAAVATASAAQAQMPREWELTAFGGGFLAGDIYSAGSATIQVDDTWTYGARIGTNLSPTFGLEASYARASSDLSARGIADYTGALGTVTFDQIDLNGNFGSGFYRQAYGYFTLGIGMTILTPHAADVNTDTNTRFSTNIGLGLKYFMSPKLGLRLDGRYRLTDTNISTDDYVYCDPYYGCYSYYSTWYDSGEITAGLVYKLGAK